jgi:uncharacterized protein (TIGR02996 family)
VTTEDDFQSALDKNPHDWQTRLVFADWLQEHNDPRAEGYRIMGTLRLYTALSIDGYAWFNGRHFPTHSYGESTHTIPAAVFAHLKGGCQLFGGTPDYDTEHPDKWRDYPTRRAAEDALAAALVADPATTTNPEGA